MGPLNRIEVKDATKRKRADREKNVAGSKFEWAAINSIKLFSDNLHVGTIS
jgi:hypothetical protein